MKIYITQYSQNNNKKNTINDDDKKKKNKINNQTIKQSK